MVEERVTNAVRNRSAMTDALERVRAIRANGREERAEMTRAVIDASQDSTTSNPDEFDAALDNCKDTE